MTLQHHLLLRSYHWTRSRCIRWQHARTRHYWQVGLRPLLRSRGVVRLRTQWQSYEL